jgi:hypothetical protein
VEEAAYQGIAKAVELIDLNDHQGEHPRLGRPTWYLLCRSLLGPCRNAAK